jgi:hypothetical protein
MHFDWTIPRGGKTCVTESLISCGFLGPTSLFIADNVHAHFINSCEAAEGQARFGFRANRPRKNSLFMAC